MILPDSFIRSITFLLYLAVALLFSGCEEDLDLREDFEEPFTLYGLLSPNLTTQYVRVYPIESFLRLDPEEPENIRFTSTDLATGEEIVWQDTVDIGPNGQKDLLFKATFRPEHEHIYRVMATRVSDGASSYADVRIPPLVTVRSEDVVLEPVNEAILDVFVEGEGIRILKPEIIYDVRTCDRGEVGPLDTYIFQHHQLEEPTENGWHIPFNIWFDRTFILFEPFKLILSDVFVTFIVGDEVWDPPFGRFDANLLSNPGVLDNVQNGLGFVGSGYRMSAQVTPGCELINDAEYYCMDVLTDNERLPC